MSWKSLLEPKKSRPILRAVLTLHKSRDDINSTCNEEKLFPSSHSFKVRFFNHLKIIYASHDATSQHTVCWAVEEEERKLLKRKLYTISFGAQVTRIASSCGSIRLELLRSSVSPGKKKLDGELCKSKFVCRVPGIQSGKSNVDAKIFHRIQMPSR